MFEIVAVTNHACCKSREAYIRQLKKIAASGVDKIILREKDLPPGGYETLAREILRDCEGCGAELLLHRFTAAARALGHLKIHLPLPVFEAEAGIRQDFETIGVSVHSREQAEKALALGADYLSAGHVFATDCKKGLAPRGLDFLSEICALSPVPVYAIGGISEKNIRSVREAGAAGACVMSSVMKSENPEEYVRVLLKNVK